MTRIALLSHRGGNIGHDFMAVGMEVALKQAFGAEVQIDHFEQHNHFEIYPKGQLLRLMHKIPHGKLRFVRRYLNRPATRQKYWPQTLPLNYNLAVASGGPNIVPGGSKAVELGLMLHHMNGAFKYRDVPLIDAGVGASFPLEHIPEELESSADREFYQTAIGFCRLITVRDSTAQKIVRKLGFDSPLIPCGAIGTGRVFQNYVPNDGSANKHVLINFQKWGANTDWGQGVNAAEWMRTMQAVITDLEKRHSIMILAQNAYERVLAAQLAPHVRCEFPTTVEDYARTINQAKVAIASRIHAAIPLAGIGVPSVVIGTDTRLGTVEQMGLPISYVKKATAPWLIDQVETLVANAEYERERLIALRESTIARYAEIFRANAKTVSGTS